MADRRALGIGTAGLVGAIQYKLKPTYEASSVLRIEPTQHDLFGNGLNATENFDAYLQTQVQLILSAKVLKSALNDPEVRRIAGTEFVLRKAIQVQVVPRTFLIEVAMRRIRPARPRPSSTPWSTPILSWPPSGPKGRTAP